ncbi:MAG: potassium channel family protein [Verrucomicrobiota bacterium]|nr:potassium channel family protein [Verrucomicrobiota bacterium]
MLSKLLSAWSLMALCVVVHAMGMTASLRWLRNSTARVDTRFWFSTWLLVRIAGWIILLHLVEIALWAFFYTWKHGMPDLQSALYFSAVTYTTTGYGDLLLPNEWRLIGGVEALTGILMCGWSTGFFFIVATKLYGVRVGGKAELK